MVKTMSDACNEVKIRPQVEDLMSNKKICCTEEGCKAFFANPANFHMHLTKHHHKLNIVPKYDANTVKMYYCPVEDCSYSGNMENSKHFTALKYVRQHYQKVHMEKIHQCGLCTKRFPTKAMKTAHEATCGRIYTCGQCGWTYRSRQKLLEHGRLKRHNIEQTANANISQITADAVLGVPVNVVMQNQKNCENKSTQAEIINNSRYVVEAYEQHNNQAKTKSVQILSQNNHLPEAIENALNEKGTCISFDVYTIIDNSAGLCNIETQTELPDTLESRALQADTFTQTYQEFFSDLQNEKQSKSESSSASNAGCTWLCDSYTQKENESKLIQTDLAGLLEIVNYESKRKLVDNNEHEEIVKRLKVQPQSSTESFELGTTVSTTEKGTSITYDIYNGIVREDATGENNLNSICYSQGDINNCFGQLAGPSSLCDTETQTEYPDSLLNKALYSNTYTQTCGDILTDMCLNDIETQTPWAFESSIDCATATTVQDINELFVSTETQTSFSQCLQSPPGPCNSYPSATTQHTQTCNDLLDGLFGERQTDLIPEFQSTHTQT